MAEMGSNEIKNMDSNIFKNLKRKLSPDETFDFPTLPYVCQRRFAEICDPQTLKCFATINQNTKNLVKRCHIIDNVKILCGIDSPNCNYRLLCFCKENEFCKGIFFDGKVIQFILSSSNNVKIIINPPYYILLELSIHGKIRKKLLLFTDETRKSAYEYTWDNKQESYRCKRCYMMNKKHVSAKLLRNQEGEEYIQISPNQHACIPITFTNV